MNERYSDAENVVPQRMTLAERVDRLIERVEHLELAVKLHLEQIEMQHARLRELEAETGLEMRKTL